ncbi:ribosome biogenesis factor YjgA [Marinobacter lacisalsi]|uniref:Dual-action ribosomal maturation protein DarP n=1 Tax=Marinobacter lacisalsi TaxID=475979 RepID=A0ABV8QJK2_9GAMM
MNRQSTPQDAAADDDELIKSKSQLKREMHALQELGKRMMDLSDEQLASLPISETLKAAIVESRRIRQHEARRRHLQYVGKVIRNEADPDGLRRSVEAFDAGSEEHTRRHHLAERWRDRLIAEGNTAVAGFVEQCPATDVQHLRNLLRNAQKDVKSGNNTGHSKKLFRYLRECIDEAERSS